MERLIQTIVLYLMLVVFALVGVFYLAPRVAEVLRDRLTNAAHAGE